MKKKILCIALASSFMCMNAFAATDVSVVDNKVTVEVDSEAGKWGTLIVTKSGDSLDDENIIAMKQAVADENGKAIFTFSMPATLEGGVNGEYDLHIKTGTDDIRTESMYYVISEDRNNLIDDLKNEADIKSIFDNPDNDIPLKALGVYLDTYNKFKEADIQNGNTDLTDSACEAFVNNRTADMSDEEVIDLLNETLIIQEINVLPDKGVETIEKLGFSFENTKYIDADSTTKSFVCDYIYSNKPYNSIDEIKKAYDVANMLNVINNARFDAIESKITGYAQGLGIAGETIYTTYVSSSNKTDINEDIVVALKSQKVVTVQALLAVIDTATKNNPAGSGGAGGGGAGGGAGGNGDRTMNVPSNPLTNIPTESYISPFSDISNVEWAKDAIYAMAKEGIIAGDESGKFNPDNFVKREEFVKMLVMAADMYNADAKCELNDVDAGAWYYSYVASAYNSNMVYGTSESTFGIGEYITRQDMAVMCYRVAKNTNRLNKVRDSVSFADESSISDYAKEAVNALYEAGGINGVGNNMFDPSGTATRAQAAVMIHNLFVK